MSASKITVLISTIYFILGNLVGLGIHNSILEVDGLLYYIFFPYTLVWGISAMVGADWLTLALILISFFISLTVFFPFGLYFSKSKKH